MHHSGALRHHIWTTSVIHDSVGRFSLAVHHGLRSGAILKAVEVELHAIGHARHVEEVMELIFGSRSHRVIMTVPGG